MTRGGCSIETAAWPDRGQAAASTRQNRFHFPLAARAGCDVWGISGCAESGWTSAQADGNARKPTTAPDDGCDELYAGGLAGLAAGACVDQRDARRRTLST
ncbi:hypothetical protein GCM10027081_25040 [Cupriavidus yeoncheonensis]